MPDVAIRCRNGKWRYIVHNERGECLAVTYRQFMRCRAYGVPLRRGPGMIVVLDHRDLWDALVDAFCQALMAD